MFNFHFLSLHHISIPFVLPFGYYISCDIALLCSYQCQSIIALILTTCWTHKLAGCWATLSSPTPPTSSPSRRSKAWPWRSWWRQLWLMLPRSPPRPPSRVWWVSWARSSSASGRDPAASLAASWWATSALKIRSGPLRWRHLSAPWPTDFINASMSSPRGKVWRQTGINTANFAVIQLA